MEWSSAAIGFGGLLVAALSLYLGYRARTSPYRERLYDRRLDAYGEIVRRLGDLHDEVQVALPTSADAPLDASRLRLQTREPADAFVQAYRLWRVFLTKRINEPIIGYVQAFGSLAADSAAASEARMTLDQAFERVTQAANAELGVDILSLQTSALFGAEAAPAASTPSISVVTAVGAYWHAAFEDFQPEDQGRLRPGTSVEPSSDLREERDRAYDRNRNVFLTHTWRPSETAGQVADISIRLLEHVRRHGSGSKERPLSDSLVEKVEYHVGRSWFGGGSVVKTNAEENFKLDISAYGSTLCVARVLFKDGSTVSLQRYLDFADVRTS